MKSVKISTNSVVVVALFYLMTIAQSPFFPGALNIPTSVMYFPVLLLLFLYSIKSGINKTHLIYSVLFMSATLLLALKAENIIYFNRYIFAVIPIVLSYWLVNRKGIINKLVDWLSVFGIIAIILSWISFFYALNGGGSIFDFPNPDTRMNHFYLFSFSNAIIGNVIRPAFLYDEPGALSFYISAIAMLRVLLNRDKKVTFMLLVGGMVTTSLAQLVILVLFMILNLKKHYLLLALFFLSVVTLQLYDKPEFSFFFNRFKVTENGEFKGDNRSNQVDNFMRIVTTDIVLYGNYKCLDYANRHCPTHGDISSSYVSPLYNGGLLMLFVQLLTHITFIWASLKKRLNKQVLFAAVGMSLLLLQRPYFGSVSYSLYIYLILFLCLFFNGKDHLLKN